MAHVQFSHHRTELAMQAGNSGLCGGSVPIAGEVILLTSKLDKILHFDDVSALLEGLFLLQCLMSISIYSFSRHHPLHDVPCGLKIINSTPG